MSKERERTGRSLIFLNTGEGLDRFKNALVSSNGCALVVVHPYFPDCKNEQTELYIKYKKRLIKEVKRYQGMGLPFVLFEAAGKMGTIDESLDRMGKENGDIFIVQTEADSSDPNEGSFAEFATELRGAGLHRAIVAGTELRRSFYLNENAVKQQKENNYPSFSIKYDLSLCVGRVINTFLKKGIRATPAFAAYPGRFYTSLDIID